MLGQHSLRIRTVVAAVLAICLAYPAVAQNPAGEPAGVRESAPTIRGVLRNSDLVLDRLKTVLSLTSPEDQKQYQTLKDFIEVFLIGVDRTKPVRMDVFTTDEETTYRLDIPVLKSDFADFWQLNLVPLGIPVQQYATQRNLFRLGGGPNDAFTGYMLYAPNKRGGYATIAETGKLLPAPGSPSPVKGVQTLLNTDFDAVIRLQNEPEGVERRHARFAADKDEVLAELQRQANESEADFALRKFAAGVQFDETERIYAEAKNLIAGAAVTADPARGRLEFTLEALPDTPLADSIGLLGQEPSRFASVPVPENATSTGRINFPLDEFRKQHFLAMSKKFRENELAEAEAIEGATAEQIAATKNFLNGLFDRLDAGIEAGVIDAFMDMTQNEQGVHTVVGGVVSPNAAEWVPVLELIAQLKDPPTFKKEIGKVGDISLHEIVFPEGKNPAFEDLFGGRRLIIGAGGETVWYAAGPEADARIKATIEAAEKPGEPSSTIVTFRGELLPAFKILDRRQGEKGDVDLRARAIEAFQNGQGQVELDVVRKGESVAGKMVVDGGVLRLIGASLAKMSRENLAE